MKSLPRRLRVWLIRKLAGKASVACNIEVRGTLVLRSALLVHNVHCVGVCDQPGIEIKKRGGE